MIENLIEVDALVVLGSIIQTIGAVLALIGLQKYDNSGLSLTRGPSKEVKKYVNAGSRVTLIALIPLTIYATTRIFPTLFQQFVVTAIVLAGFAYFDGIRDMLVILLGTILSLFVAALFVIIGLLINLVSYFTPDSSDEGNQESAENNETGENSVSS